MNMRTHCFFRILKGIKNYELACGYYSEDYLTGQKDLTNTELQILIQLDTYPSINANGIAEALWLEKSTIARSITALEKKGYLTREKSTTDKREYVLTLTDAARPLLDFQIDFHQEIFRKFSSHLNGEELLLIGSYMKRFADGEGIADIPLRPGEVIHIVEMRRLGRSHSTIGTSFMNSGYSALEFQILTEIEAEDGSITPSSLSHRMRIPKNSLSQILSRLRNKKLVIESVDSNDRRSKFLGLSDSGVQALEHIRNQARSHYHDVFIDFTSDELLEFCTLFERYIGFHSTSGSEKEFTIAPNAVVRVLGNDEELMRARGFHILNIVRLREHTQVPEELLHSNNTVYGLFVNDAMEAVLELKKDEQSYSVVNASESAAFTDSQRTISFYKLIIDRALREGNSVEVPKHSSMLRYRQHFGNSVAIEGNFIFKQMN